MAFSSEDLYTLSGGVEIFNYWNPFVTKHDTSSFYNWEQDNLPLYDLEERTHYLWEKFGYPLSAVPSMALVVSSSIDTTLDLSTNMFTSIQDAIDALPEIIRMPTLIEVAVSGEIGAINLNNIKCEDDGVLEIVNRGFAPLMYSEAAAYSTAPTDYYYSDHVIDASEFLDAVDATSALSVSANTASLFTADGDPNGFTRSVYVPTYTTSANVNNAARTSYAFAGVGGTGTTFRNGVVVDLNPITITDDSSIGTLDLSTISENDGTTEYRGGTPIEEQAINGFVTANALSGIQVENSDGPIYIRGFIVDGQYPDAGGSHEVATGIKVYNSNNITLEYCGAIRCTTHGAEFKNSNVNLCRGFGAVRNYDSDDRGTIKTYGIKADNSIINLVTDTYTSGIDFVFMSQFHDVGVSLTNSELLGGDVKTTALDRVSHTNFTVGYNSTGVDLVNSKFSVEGFVELFNNGTNLKALGSHIEVEQLMSRNAQKEGMLLDGGSTFRYNKNLSTNLYNEPKANSENTLSLHFETNGTHVVAKGGSYVGPTYTSSMVTYYPYPSYFVSSHGAELKNDGTESRVITPGIVADNATIEVLGGRLISVNNPAVDGVVRGMLAQSRNGGKVVLRAMPNDSLSLTRPHTQVQGPSTYLLQKNTAGLAAVDGGSLYVFGPTVIYNQGIGLLAQNSSKIFIGPHLDKNLTTLDASTWGLDDHYSHTAVEIHATRSCMVADDNSEIRMEDCGDWHTTWDADLSPVGTDLGVTYHDADYDSSGFQQGLFTSAGCIQFYPNVMESTIAVPDAATAGTATRPLFTNSIGVNAWTAKDNSTSSLRLFRTSEYSPGSNADTEIRTFSTGGMCVRATNGSHIYVKNVNFPMGHVNADDSFLDPSASIAGCNDLRIWNIADTSRLTASYCSVSGLYPSFAGYSGPRSVYFSSTTGQDQDSSAVAYAGWSGLPDTSTLSVLDHFGSGVEVSANVLDSFFQALGPLRTGNSTDDTYGPSSYENRGPFRLYFSVPAVARTLAYFSGTGATLGINTEDNRPAQHLAQGYNLSGSVSANSDLSSIYPDMLRYDEDLAAITTSGHFQMSALFPDVDRNQIVLDESAANLFANAKHCSTDYSGRKKFVTIHRATTSVHGEGHTPDSTGTDTSGLGSGFRSSNVFDLGRDV